MATLRLRALDVALTQPFRIAYDVVTQVSNVLVEVEGDGHVGFGEAAPVKTITGETGPEAAAAFTAWRRAGGKLPSDARIVEHLRLPSPAMRTAVEGALLDQQARTQDVPLCTHLTGAKPAAVASSITLGLGDDAAIEPWVAKQRAAGFRILKVKAGLGIDRDLVRVQRVREAAGPTVELRVDPNQGWSRADTERALPRLADLGVRLLEQPLPKHDLAGHAAVRRTARTHGVALMLDESVFSPADAQAALQAQACDWINIKLQKCGGAGPALQIADLAQAAGVPCMIGCMVETRIGILHAVHVALAHDNIVAADLDGHTFLAADPVQGGPRFQDGHLDPGRAPGLGVSSVEAGRTLDALTEVAA